MVSRSSLAVKRSGRARASALPGLGPARGDGIHWNAEWHRHRPFRSFRSGSGGCPRISYRFDANVGLGLVQRTSRRRRIAGSVECRVALTASAPLVLKCAHVLSARVLWLL